LSAPDTDGAGIVQIKVWLLGISPVVWRLPVPSTCTLRQLHGVLQLAMGWKGIHLYQFCLRAARYVCRRAMMNGSARDRGVLGHFRYCWRIPVGRPVSSACGTSSVSSSPDRHRQAIQ